MLCTYIYNYLHIYYLIIYLGGAPIFGSKHLHLPDMKQTYITNPLNGPKQPAGVFCRTLGCHAPLFGAMPNCSSLFRVSRICQVRQSHSEKELLGYFFGGAPPEN